MSTYTTPATTAVDIVLFGVVLALVSHHGGYWHVG
jgi:hypothetical protein